jgi:hypothetical protein
MDPAKGMEAPQPGEEMKKEVDPAGPVVLDELEAEIVDTTRRVLSTLGRIGGALGHPGAPRAANILSEFVFLAVEASRARAEAAVEVRQERPTAGGIAPWEEAPWRRPWADRSV